MDTVEVVVYMSIAVIIGAMVLVAVGKFSASDAYDRIRGLFDPEDTKFAQVDNETLPPLLFRTWEGCGLGTISKNVTFKYSGATPTDSVLIFREIKRLNLCDTFSDVSQTCGKRNDLVMPVPVEDGRIYTASCDPLTRKLLVI
jgi:hypothetical protein